MSSSAETFSVTRPRRESRVGKIVAVTLIGLAAVPVTLFVGAWAARQISEGSPSTPTKVTVSTTVR